jgi:ComEC/Rec2-related protein
MVFSVLQLGDLIQKPKFPLNSLFLATLILFFLDAEIVYDVGYQLSFAAVYGILSFQKPISGFWNPAGKWKRKIRDDISLTLAATLATCPIILFYFHQFPVYFLAANLLAVPLSNFLIYMGIGLISLSWIPVVKTLAGLLVHGTILLLNGFILGISRLPFSVIENLFIPLWALIPLFGFLIFFQLFLHRFQHKWLVFSLFGLLFFSGSVFGYQTWLSKRQEKKFIIRTGDEWMMGSVSGRKANLLLLGSDTLKTPNSFEAKALREGFHVQEIAFGKIQGRIFSASNRDSSRQSRLIAFGEKTILILGNYLKIRQKPKEKIAIDVLISRNAGFKTLENAFTLFEPGEIWGNFSEKTMKELSTKFPQYQWINFKSKRYRAWE